MPVPAQPKIYHICHVDRLASIVADGFLWSDSEIAWRSPPGTAIGMSGIKYRRLHELKLTSHRDLHVGKCVPFYFCPRSIMLYLMHRANHSELSYTGGQGPIIHIEADLRSVVQWAESAGLRWAFTLGNAGSRYFEDRADLARLDDLDWDAIQARNWSSCKEGKQAEFLVEERLPFDLIERIGVFSEDIYRQATNAVQKLDKRPLVEIIRDWYY